jgi:hypothetical protein
MLIIKNLTGKSNGFAIIDTEELANDNPKPILSGLEYNQAEREFLRIKKEKATGNSVLQDRGCDRRQADSNL